MTEPEGPLIEATKTLHLVFVEAEQRTVNDPFWQLTWTDDNDWRAFSVYVHTRRPRKVLVRWDVWEGVSIARAELGEAIWFDYSKIPLDALASHDDIAWDVAMAVTDYCKTRYLFQNPEFAPPGLCEKKDAEPSNTEPTPA